MSSTQMYTEDLKRLVLESIAVKEKARELLREESIQRTMNKKLFLFTWRRSREKALELLENNMRYIILEYMSAGEERLHELLHLIKLADMNTGLVSVSAEDAALLNLDTNNTNQQG